MEIRSEVIAGYFTEFIDWIIRSIAGEMHENLLEFIVPFLLMLCEKKKYYS